MRWMPEAAVEQGLGQGIVRQGGQGGIRGGPGGVAQLGKVRDGHVVRFAHEAMQEVVDLPPAPEHAGALGQVGQQQRSQELPAEEAGRRSCGRERVELHETKVGTAQPNHRPKIGLQLGVACVVPSRFELREIDVAVFAEQRDEVDAGRRLGGSDQARHLGLLGPRHRGRRRGGLSEEPSRHR